MAEMGINVYFSGQNYFITAERLQILDLLLSTYENAFHQNRKLLTLQEEMRELNEQLEEIVKDRTRELSDANRKLKIELAERMRAEEKTAVLQEQLHQAQRMETVGRLAGGVAHDYNNMLSVILGYTHLALEQADASSPLYEHLQEILSAANRSTEITRQLLAFARKQTIDPQVVDLNETISGMINMIKRLIGENIYLNWRPGPERLAVKIDPAQMDQLLANLCVNARDAISEKGTIEIETGKVNFEADYCSEHPTVVPGPYVYLVVSDDGCGMDKDILDKVFEPFFTTKETGQGTGLGLSTVYGIVKQHDGFINVYSEPRQGTAFRIYLPQYLGEDEEPHQAEEEEIQQGKGETVLVVEDEESILSLICIILSDLGYKVLHATNGVEALELVDQQKENIDLVISDVVMPEMNGRELVEKLLHIYPEMKSLFISGYTANIIASHGVLEEGMHLLQKPFSAKELAANIREALES